MCGVIGYVGPGANPQFFFQGLKRLEYRGYDSAGIAVLDKKGAIHVVRAEGKLNQLEQKLSELPPLTSLGMGHTRWATHGKPSEPNAHPHRSGPIVLLHNGIIENYRPLKEILQRESYEFLSETDSEVAAHYLHHFYKKYRAEGQDPKQSMKSALFDLVGQIRGAFAFGIMCAEVPDVLFTVKWGSPLVLGLGENAYYMASGIAALVDHTRSMMVLEDGDIAYLTPQGVELVNFQGQPVSRSILTVDWHAGLLEKNGFDHFMLKEIHEEPVAVAQTLSARLDRSQGTINLTSLGIKSINLEKVRRIQIVACGTSYYAGLLASYFLEEWAHLPTEVHLASEYRYRTCTANAETLVIALSQSGETIDTLQAVKHARTKDAQTLAMVNAPGSTIAHHCHDESLIFAGPEVGVATTKAFAAHIATLMMFAMSFISDKALRTSLMDQLAQVPGFLERMIENCTPHVKKLADKIVQTNSILFMGRGPQWPIAAEGALKLKELSYIHAEAYAGGELKHGPIALVDENMFVVCLAPRDRYYEKTLSNVEEVKARGARIIGIGTEGDVEMERLSEEFLSIPQGCPEAMQPFLTVLLLHILAYWTARKKGYDVDQPRNLAKSVTVE